MKIAWIKDQPEKAGNIYNNSNKDKDNRQGVNDYSSFQKFGQNLLIISIGIPTEHINFENRAGFPLQNNIY